MVYIVISAAFGSTLRLLCFALSYKKFVVSALLPWRTATGDILEVHIKVDLRSDSIL